MKHLVLHDEQPAAARVQRNPAHCLLSVPACLWAVTVLPARLPVQPTTGLIPGLLVRCGEEASPRRPLMSALI